MRHLMETPWTGLWGKGQRKARILQCTAAAPALAPHSPVEGVDALAQEMDPLDRSLE